MLKMHKHAAYLVDALIDTHPMMKDWECMIQLLLEEPPRGEQREPLLPSFLGASCLVLYE